MKTFLWLPIVFGLVFTGMFVSPSQAMLACDREPAERSAECVDGKLLEITRDGCGNESVKLIDAKSCDSHAPRDLNPVKGPLTEPE